MPDVRQVTVIIANPSGRESDNGRVTIGAGAATAL